MNINENKTCADARDEVIELGVASLETQGDLGRANEGVFHTIMPGISEE